MQQSHAWFAVFLSLAAPSVGCRHASEPPASAPPGAASPAPAPSPPPAYGGPVVEVPAGSRLILRIDDNVDSGRMSAGQRFRASLDAALLDASGRTVVPVRTRVFGIIVDSKSAGHLAGKSEIELAFTDLEIDGALFPIQSQGVKAVGEGSGGGTVRKVGAGALIGGAIGGGKGAAKGAAVGGAVALLSRGKAVRVPSGTLLELTLAAPAKVPAPQDAAAPAPAPAPAPAAAAAAPPVGEDPEKACVKKLMSNGFSADEALSSCKKEK